MHDLIADSQVVAIDMIKPSTQAVCGCADSHVPVGAPCNYTLSFHWPITRPIGLCIVESFDICRCARFDGQPVICDGFNDITESKTFTDS